MDWIEVKGTALRYELTGSAGRTIWLVTRWRHAGKLGRREAGAQWLARAPLRCARGRNVGENTRTGDVRYHGG